jgi:hypothetical protein
MPPDFLSKMIVTCGFAPNGTINKKELVNILKFDYCNKLLENKDIEVVEGEIDSSQLQIDEYLCV